MRAQIHSAIYFIGLILMAFFMPLSIFVTNASMLMIVANWVAECDLSRKWKQLLNNKIIFVFIAIYIVHLVWLLNTSNFSYAKNDLIIKLPLLALPIIFGTSYPLSGKKIKIILSAFVFGVLLSTIIGFVATTVSPGIVNFREMAMFVSNIRLSLMICFSIFILFYFIEKKCIPTKIIWLPILIVLWMLLFMAMLQSVTGFICVTIVSLVIAIAYAVKTTIKYKRILCIVYAIILPIAIAYCLIYFISDFYKPTGENIQYAKTENGNPYDEIANDSTIENGNYVCMNICNKELFSTWQLRSNVPLDSLDNKGQQIYYTLIRYMTSLGLTKDSCGVSKLSSDDIVNIENGEANYRFAKNGGLDNRIYVMIWEFDVYLKTGACNGHSASQRIEFAKYGIKIILKNFLTGTGVGDVNDEYQKLYEEENTNLLKEYRHRAHNQFFTFFISFGIFGFLICVFGWFYPAFAFGNIKNYYFAIFFLIATISMLSDDTLETSTGAVFVAFFYSLLLWATKRLNKSTDQSINK